MGEHESASSHAHAARFDDGGFFGVLVQTQSYLNIVYFLLSFPLAIIYFVFLVTGLALGFGLAIIGIGLVILLVVLIAMRGFAALERWLGMWLLGAEIPPPSPGPVPWQHPLIALKKYVTDSYTWKSLIYLLAKFPAAIATFVIVVSFGSTTVTLILAPLVYRYLPIHVLHWRIARIEDAMLCLAFGLVLGLLSFHLVNVLASAWRAFSVWMLTGIPRRRSEVRSGPIVIP
jgi:hypothetical protein